MLRISCFDSTLQKAAWQVAMRFGVAASAGVRSGCFDRHTKRINIAFQDGSSRAIPLQELWSLHWKAGWVDPTPLPVVPPN